MLQGFRKVFKSKVGLAITLAFLALIAFAFASSDVANTGMFGGVSGGDRVAVVGDQRIDAAELSMAATSALEQMRQADPTMTMPAFVAQGGLEDVLDQLVQRTALAEFARRHGMRAGDRLIDSELMQIAAFRGPDGQFDERAFRAAIAQRRLSESAVRADLRMGLLVRQVITPIAFSPVTPISFGERYAALLRERRRGAFIELPSAAFAPQGDPTAAQLEAFYRENSNRYIRPERRVIRFAQFGEEALGTLPAPTEAQIAQRYEQNRAQYAASERRRLTQLILPTQDAAQAIAAEVRGGTSLEAAATQRGLATATVGPVGQEEFARTSSTAVAQAAFAATQGSLTQPARGSLGWYLLRIEAVERQPARTLDQARAEIAAQLAEEQRRQALTELTAELENEFRDGRSLSEVASRLDLTITSTAPATADGRIYANPDQTVPPILGRVLETAFDMREGEPQLAEVVPGEAFVVFDVTDIAPSATAPLAEIREDVVRHWRMDQGAQAARAAADRIVERVSGGSSLAQAVASEQATLPAVRPIDLNREELARAGRTPPALALMFSMAAGTVKRLEAPGDAGWTVVALDEIEPGAVTRDDPVVLATLQQLGSVTGEEYVQQFVRAAQREVGVQRNDPAIRAVASQLTGQQAD